MAMRDFVVTLGELWDWAMALPMEGKLALLCFSLIGCCSMFIPENMLTEQSRLWQNQCLFSDEVAAAKNAWPPGEAAARRFRADREAWRARLGEIGRAGAADGKQGLP